MSTKTANNDSRNEQINDVNKFLEGFFGTIKHIIHEEELFFNKLNTPIVTTVDYIKMIRFLRTAYNMIGEIDTDFEMKSPYLLKLFKDCDALYDIYSTKSVSNVLFETEFLANHKPYKMVEAKLKDSIDLRNSCDHSVKLIDNEIKSMSSKTDPESVSAIRKLNNKLADAVHNFATHRDEANRLSALLDEMHKRYKELFIPRFDHYQKTYSAKLTLVLNKKLFLLERVLSFEASKSKLVEDFFVQAGIAGEFSIKLFIQNYIKNINAECSQDSQWHTYLKNILHSMD